MKPITIQNAFWLAHTLGSDTVLLAAVLVDSDLPYARRLSYEDLPQVRGYPLLRQHQGQTVVVVVTQPTLMQAAEYQQFILQHRLRAEGGSNISRTVCQILE